MKITFKVSGLKEAEQALKRLPTVALRKEVVRNAWVYAADPLLQDIRYHTPIDTGDLVRSIAITDHPEVGDRSELRMQVGVVGEFYGHFQEFGTSRQPARPFVRPAWDRNKRELINRFADAIRKAVNAYLRERNRVHASGLVPEGFSQAMRGLDQRSDMRTPAQKAVDDRLNAEFFERMRDAKPEQGPGAGSGRGSSTQSSSGWTKAMSAQRRKKK